MNLTFKLATPNDVTLIAQLAHKIWHEHYPPIIKFILPWVALSFYNRR